MKNDVITTNFTLSYHRLLARATPPSARWVHEMRRAAVRDYLELYGMRLFLAGADANKIVPRIVDAERIALCILDRGDSAHRAIREGKAIIEGRWDKKPAPGGAVAKAGHEQGYGPDGASRGNV